MVIYVDLIFLINFIFDFSLILLVDVLLKRNTKYPRILLGALIGELSMVTLFVHLNSIENFIFKIVLTGLMSLGSFSYKDLKYTGMNIIYLYLSGIILGGFEYYLYNEFQVNRLGYKYLIIICLAPLALFIYYKIISNFKINYKNRYKVKIDYDEYHFEGVGFLDSGNKLICPITNKKIVLVEKEYIIYHKLKLFPVPYNALNHHGVLYCFSPTELLINDRPYKNVLIGLSDVKFNIDGCNVLLNARMEEL